MKIKRILAVSLALLMLVGLAGCKKGRLFKKSKTEPLSITLSLVRFDDGQKEIFVKHKNRFIKTVAPTYGMSEEQANDLVTNPDKYGIFTIDTTLSNKEKKGYTFEKITVDGAHDGIWFCEDSVNGQVGVPSGVTTDDYVISFVANTEKLSAAAIYQTLSGLTFSIRYYETPANDDDVVEESKYKTLAARNTITSPDHAEDGKDIKVSLASIEDGDDFAKLYRSDKKRLMLYGYPEAVADRFASKKSNWECYVLNIKVSNGCGEEAIFYGTSVAQNGTGGVWVAPKSVDGDECGLAAGTEGTFGYLLLVDPSVAGGATIADTVKGMNLSLLYSVERTDIEQIETCLRVPNAISVAGE